MAGSRVVNGVKDCLWGGLLAQGSRYVPFCARCRKGFLAKGPLKTECVSAAKVKGFGTEGCLWYSNAFIDPKSGRNGENRAGGGFGVEGRLGAVEGLEVVDGAGDGYYCSLCDGLNGYFQVDSKSDCVKVPMSHIPKNAAE